MKFENSDLSKLEEISSSILGANNPSNLICFFGEMGTGKTTLIKQICSDLKVVDEVKSPTFSLVNEYANEDGETIYHFDFYRIKSIEEVYDIGIEEYFDSGNLILVEWPELVEDLLPESYLKVEIQYEEDKRTYSINTLE